MSISSCFRVCNDGCWLKRSWNSTQPSLRFRKQHCTLSFLNCFSSKEKSKRSVKYKFFLLNRGTMFITLSNAFFVFDILNNWSDIECLSCDVPQSTRQSRRLFKDDSLMLSLDIKQASWHTFSTNWAAEFHRAIEQLSFTAKAVKAKIELGELMAAWMVRTVILCSAALVRKLPSPVVLVAPV